MAATRLIPLHINKGKTVARCLFDRTRYYENVEKTENGKYVSAYECSAETCDEEFLLAKRQYEHITGRKQAHDVIAYQIRQSFKPGEVTPEEANAVGYELAMRFTKGRHAFIIATHTDKAHIHNHIIFNSTSLDCTRKFRNFKLSAIALARLSDLICLEHNLSVIKPKPYREHIKRTEYPKRESIRDGICREVDAAMGKEPENWNALIELLQAVGYEYKPGKHPAIRGEGQKRFIRFDSLGEGYTHDDLCDVMDRKRVHQSKFAKRARVGIASRQAHQRPEMSFLIDIQAKMQEGKGGGYARWAKVFNLKQMAQAMMFMQEHGIKSYDELNERAASISAHCDDLLESINADEARLQEIAVMKKHIINFAKAKDVFAAYKKSGYNRDFFEAHRDVLTLRKAAKDAFDQFKKQHGKDTPLPKVADLNAEYAAVLARKKTAYREYRKEKNEAQEWLVAQRIVQTILSEDQQKEQQLEQEATQEKEQR